MKWLIYLDTETTGIKDARMVELAYRVQGGEPVSLRCKPPKPIELDASVVNGIRDRDVVMLLPFQDMPAYADIKETLENGILIAHNAPFDIAVLEREGIIIHEWIDTKEMAMAIYPEAPKHRLQHLRYWLDLDVDTAGVASPIAHTATGDIQVLEALWHKMTDGFEESMVARFKHSS